MLPGQGEIGLDGNQKFPALNQTEIFGTNPGGRSLKDEIRFMEHGASFQPSGADEVPSDEGLGLDFGWVRALDAVT